MLCSIAAICILYLLTVSCQSVDITRSYVSILVVKPYALHIYTQQDQTFQLVERRKMATPMLSYDPPAHEIAYYEKLFAIADPAHVGQIQGRDAVAFLARSTLPMEALKGIWVMADTNPTTHSLDKRKFFTAVRLIQLSQNGKTASGPTLLVLEGTPLHPPYFDGIPVVMTEAPTTAAAAAPSHVPPVPTVSSTTTTTAAPGASNALALADPYMMQPGDQSKYETLFPQYEQEGFVYGPAAVTLFSKSGLDNELLRDIWNMVDNPVDNRLSKLEFAIAMHLIVCISKKNLPMPTSLPPSLEALKKAEAFQQQQPPHLHPAVMTAPMTPPHSSIVTTSPQTSSRTVGRMSVGDAFDDLNPQPNPTYMPPNLQLQPPPTAGDSGASTIPPAHIPTMIDMGLSGSMRNVTTTTSETGLVTPSTTTMTPSLSIQRPTLFPPGSSALNVGHTFTEPSSVSSVVPTPSLTTLGAKVKLSEAGYSTHVASTSAEEVMQLRSILQTLQAENISLKAQVGQFSDEEKQVRAEITHTSAEIVTLLQELTGLRNRVAEARIQLLEATAELKVLADKKGALKELVTQEQSTLTSTHAAVDNLHEAFDGLQQMKIQEKMPQSSAPSSTLEHNFFDVDSFVQVQPMPPPPAQTTMSQPHMETTYNPAQTQSDFIVYPVPEIPEYHPGNLMGGTSLSTVNRMGAGSVDGISLGGEYSIASTGDYPSVAHSSSNAAPNYYWNPDEFHEEHETPSHVEIPAEDHPNDDANGTEKPHSKDSKKWGNFLRKGGGKHSSKTTADI